MSDYYAEDGWLVMVKIERMGGGRPFIEAYVVAVNDETVAKAAVQKVLGDGETIYGLARQSGAVMETYSLFPGKLTKLPVINP